MGRSATFWLASLLFLSFLPQIHTHVKAYERINLRSLVPALALFTYCVAGYFWSIDTAATTAAVAVLLSTLITWLVLSCAIADRLGPAFTSFALGTSLMSIMLLTSDVNIDGRAEIAANVNDVAVLISLAAAWLLATITRRQTRMLTRVAAGLLLVLHVGALLATGSRTGALAVAITLFAYAAWSLARFKVGLLVAVVAGAALLIWMFHLARVTLPQRIMTLPTALEANDLNFRDVIWRAAAPDLLTPFGKGLGTTPAYMNEALGVPVVMHSVYLGIALELGVAGVALWFWLCTRITIGIRQSQWARELTMMAITIAIMASTLTLELRRPLWVFLAFVLATSVYSSASSSAKADP